MKFVRIALAISLILLSASVSDASVGIKRNGTNQGVATDINFIGGTVSNDGSTWTIDSDASDDNFTFQSGIIANGYNSGSTTSASSASHLTSASLAFGYIQKINSDTNTRRYGLANGSIGQCITISLAAIGATSDGYVIDETAAATITTNTGWDTITLDAANEYVSLCWLDDTTGWIITSTTGTISD